MTRTPGSSESLHPVTSHRSTGPGGRQTAATLALRSRRLGSGPAQPKSGRVVGPNSDAGPAAAPARPGLAGGLTGGGEYSDSDAVMSVPACPLPVTVTVAPAAARLQQAGPAASLTRVTIPSPRGPAWLRAPGPARARAPPLSHRDCQPECCCGLQVRSGRTGTSKSP